MIYSETHFPVLSKNPLIKREIRGMITNHSVYIYNSGAITVFHYEPNIHYYHFLFDKSLPTAFFFQPNAFHPLMKKSLTDKNL